MRSSLLLLFPVVLRITGVAAFSPLKQRNNNIIRHNVSPSTKLFASENNIQLDRRSFATKSIASISTVASASAALLSNSQSALADDEGTIIDPSVDPPKITNKVYLDIKFGNYKTKRMVIGLFGDVMPKTTENFLSLCSNGDVSYAGTTFYRVISDMTIQGGAIGSSSGKSSSSAVLQPDNFNIKHTKAGLVSAVRNKNGSIDSRFFIQTKDDAGWADERYAAFGIVLEEEGTGGMDVVKKISKVDVKAPQNNPKDPVMIVGCGVFEGHK
ncbi:peptidyl-prolyl cis-trans isomerase, cyclophilin type [Skeletonema marinoi]|uniref:Peptidyl-prolyl cis-trans isomerase n=1 Tax=Skeletonema marinoi TaxID=267567 RepID=A0AAD8Y7S1_9STRA|nr:peptidyl-prolyl cis-trans isomerase, cyclophilin type [Skeletonema marinoi]